MNKHTPGPWAYEYDNDTGPDDDYFVEWYGMPGVFEANREEDARLIAAAPDLLESLKAAVAFINSHAADPDLTSEMCDRYSEYLASEPHAAIAKATGEQT